MARTCRRPALGSPLRLAGRSGHCSCSLSACLVASQDCAQQQAGSCLSTEGTGPLHQTCPTGDYNSSVTKQPRLVGPAATLSPHTFVQGDARTQIDFILTPKGVGAGPTSCSYVSWHRGVPVRGKAGPHNRWAWPTPRQGQACFKHAQACPQLLRL